METQQSFDFDRLFRAVQPHLPLLIGGISTLIGGIFMLFDDVKDFGRIERLHHWQYGVILVVLGAITIAIALTYIVMDLYIGAESWPKTSSPTRPETFKNG